MKCACACGRDAVPHKDRSDLSATCRKRWVSRGRPDGPVAPPLTHNVPVVTDQDGNPVAARPDGTCACGRCGSPATYPARRPRLSEACYRRSLAAGLGGYVVPPPPTRPGTPRPKTRHPRPPKQAPEPVAEAFGITDFRAAEVLRRIPGELARAQAYTAAIARGDHRGTDAVLTRVEDLDAFDTLLDAGLDEIKARAALAEQLTREFPDIPEEQDEAA